MKRLATATIIIFGALHVPACPPLHSDRSTSLRRQRTQAPSTDGKLNVIAFGAHPDDCDIRAGGTAAKFAALGHRVRFVSVTNGDAGHQTEGGGALARAAPRRGAGGRTPHRRRLRRPRQPRRRAAAVGRRPGADHPADSPVECRPGAGTAPERLSPRPPLHGRAGAGRRLHGGRAERRDRHARVAQEPGVHVLPGRLPAAEPVQSGRGRSRSTT